MSKPEPLEDHIGDIIAKARRLAGAPLKVAADAAKVSVEALEQLESTGQLPLHLDLEGLARQLGLHPDLLCRMAAGWTPRAHDLSQWHEIRRITTTNDDLTVHCFLVWDEATRDAALFDTGWDPDPILEQVSRHGLLLKHLFLTHTHDDHMAAMPALRRELPGLRLHTNAATAPVQHRNRPDEFVPVGNLRVTHRDTPGHAEDGCIYIVGNWPGDMPAVAFTGDTLFAGSMASGFESPSLLKSSIETQLLTLPGETLVAPGHGPLTTVGEEQQHNPFFGGIHQPRVENR